MKEAEHHVEGDPRECEQPRPILSQQQADTAHDSKKLGQLDTDCIAVSGNELAKVEDEAEQADDEVEARNNNHDKGSLH